MWEIAEDKSFAFNE